MVSDFKYKLDIFRYAVKNNLFFDKVFTQLFLNAQKLVFQKGEEIKVIHQHAAFLMFLHEGAVLGSMFYKGKIVYKVIKTRQYIFVNGLWDKSLNVIDKDRWIATNRAEITAIPLAMLFEALASQPESSITLEQHIQDKMRMDFQVYYQIIGYTSIDEKIDYLVKEFPSWIRNTHKYLAEYLGVSQNGLSSAIKRWDINHFGMD